MHGLLVWHVLLFFFWWSFSFAQQFMLNACLSVTYITT